MKAKQSIAQQIVARRQQVARAVREQGVAFKEAQLSKAIIDYNTASKNAEAEAIRRAGAALNALKDLVALVEEKGLEGDAVEKAQLILIEYEILPLEERNTKPRKKPKE